MKKISRRTVLAGLGVSSIWASDADARRILLLGRAGVPLPLYSSSVGLGDSETAGAAGVDSSYYNQLSILGLGKFKQLFNAGVAGQTSTQIIARIATNVLPYSPAVCFVLMGTNDIIQGVPFSTFQQNVATCAATLRANNIAAVFVSIYPQNANPTIPPIWNAWLQSFCQANGCRFATVYNAISNGAGSLNPAYDNGDGIHLNNAGAIVAGNTVLAALSNSAPAWPLATSDTASFSNIISNAVTLANTGGVPTGFNVFGTGATSAVLNDAVLGNYIQLTLASAVSGGIQFLTAANWSVGDVLLPIFDLAISGASGLSLSMGFRFVGPNVNSLPFTPWTDNSAHGIFAGIQIPVPATTTSVSWRLYGSGSAVVNIYKPTCRNLTQAPYSYDH